VPRGFPPGTAPWTTWAWFVYPFEERETWTAKIAIPAVCVADLQAYCVSMVTWLVPSMF